MTTLTKTMQTIVDYVYPLIMAQGPSWDEESQDCQYRQKDCDNRCAVGMLIPDDAYTPMLEGQLVTNSDVQNAIAKGLYGEYINNPTFIEFLQALQHAHDNSSNKKDFTLWYNDAMTLLCADYHLKGVTDGIHNDL